jgi:hypothetical protein
MAKHRRECAWVAGFLGLSSSAALPGCGAAAERLSPDAQGGGAGFEVYPGNDAAAPPPALEREAALAATWQELGVPGAGNRPDLASTPSGWLALSRRGVGDSRAPSAWESYLYRSLDGIRWQSVTIAEDNTHLWLRGVAYGAGHYVLAGMRMGANDGVIFHSTDGEQWQEMTVATGAPSGLSDVVFAGGQFFALSTHRTIVRSVNGTEWSTIDLATTVMPLDVTFGRDQFLLVGSGDIQRSTDGMVWQPTRLHCDMPGACISNPDGVVTQGVHYRAVFAAGTYFIDQASSADGESWQPLPGLYPAASVEGYIIGTDTDGELVLWKPGEAAQAVDSVRYVETLSDAERADRMRWNGSVEPREFESENFPNGAPLPDRLEFPIPSSADCTTARCVIAGERLYLVSAAP